MKIRLNGNRWDMELRRSHITDSDKKCPFCGCEFDYEDWDIKIMVSTVFHRKRGVVECPCCGEPNTLWSREWDSLEPLWESLKEMTKT